MFAPMCLALLAFVSCVTDSETATAPECAIVSFSVADIASSVVVRKYDGTDTTVTRTISGSDIFFNIDQNKGLIYNVDSLPVWANIKRIVPTISCYGTVYAQRNIENNDSAYYVVTSGSDSIDFTVHRDFIVVSTDGRSVKHYDVDIRKSAYYTDTLAWTGYESDTHFGQNTRIVSLGNKGYMFYETNDGEMKVSCSENGYNWSESNDVAVRYNTVFTYKDSFVGLGSDSCIYSSADAKTWTKMSDKHIKTLLGSDNVYLYAFFDGKLMGTSDYETWEVCGTADLDNLPTSNVYSYSFTSRTNSNLQIALMGGISENNADYGVAWYKVTSSDKDSNQEWNYLAPTDDNTQRFPRLYQLEVTRYGNDLYAIGMEGESNDYKYLYRSTDNGLSWWAMTEKYMLPNDIEAYSGMARLASVGNEIWILRGQRLWKGVVR